MKQVYEDKLLKKSQIEKINEVNNQNRVIYAKVAHDNYLAKNAYYKQQAAYLKAYYKAEREAEYYREMQW